MITSELVLTNETFDTSIRNTNGIMMVVFWADWNTASKDVEHLVNSLAADFDFTLAKVDICKEQPLATRLAVCEVPAIHIYKDHELKKALWGPMLRVKFIKTLFDITIPAP